MADGDENVGQSTAATAQYEMGRLVSEVANLSRRMETLESRTSTGMQGLADTLSRISEGFVRRDEFVQLAAELKDAHELARSASSKVDILAVQSSAKTQLIEAHQKPYAAVIDNTIRWVLGIAAVGVAFWLGFNRDG